MASLANRRIWNPVLVFSGGLMLVSGTNILVAQTTASLQVLVLDPEGKPAAGHRIVVESVERKIQRTLVTNNRGEASAAGLLPGVYHIEGKPVQIKADELTLVRVRLQPARETVIIEASPIAAETSSVGVQTSFASQDLDRLPLPTHRYVEHSYLLPGVSTSGRPEPVVLGSPLDSNAYLIDGMPTNLTNGNAGRFGLNVSSEIIESQTLTTGGHKAEIGHTAGAVFSIVTKSGTNEFQGSLVGYSIWRSMNARPYKGLANEPGERSTDAREWAVTLGGPILKDKLFFFGAFNRQLSSIDYENVNIIGSEELRTRSQKEDRSYRFLKLTWLASDAHRMEFEYLGDPVTQTSFQSAGDGNLKDDQMPNRDRGGDSYLLHHVGTLTPTLVWENTLGIHKTHFYTYPMHFDAGPNRVQLNANEIFGRSTTESLERIRNYSFRSELTWISGPHRAKAGFQGIQGELTTAFSRPSGGVGYTDWAVMNANQTAGQMDEALLARIRAGLFAHNNSDFGYDSSFTVATPSGFTLAGGQPSYLYMRTVASLDEYGDPMKSRVLGVFAQDDYQLNPNWVINLGIRFDKANLKAEDGREIYSQNMISPRIGASWDPTAKGEFRLFAYAGRIYSPPTPGTLSLAGATTGGPETQTQVWIPLENEWKTFQSTGVQGVNNVAIADICAPRTDMFQLGAEKLQDIPGLGLWMLQAVFTTKSIRDLIDTYDIVYGYLPELDGLANSSSTGQVIANLPGLKRDFVGLDLIANRRFENGHRLQFSYSYGELTGNTEISSLASTTPANAQFAYNPSIREDYRLPRYDGELNQSVRHSFKAFGTASLPYSFELSGVFSFRTGLHYTPLRRTGGIDYIADGAKRGDHAMPSVMSLDLALAYNIKINKVSTRLAVEGFNLTSAQPMTRVNNRVAELTPLNHQQARSFQFSCRATF